MHRYTPKLYPVRTMGGFLNERKAHVVRLNEKLLTECDKFEIDLSHLKSHPKPRQLELLSQYLGASLVAWKEETDSLHRANMELAGEVNEMKRQLQICRAMIDAVIRPAAPTDDIPF